MEQEDFEKEANKLTELESEYELALMLHRKPEEIEEVKKKYQRQKAKVKKLLETNWNVLEHTLVFEEGK